MAEPIPQADDAAAYVLGTLSSRERRRFEARLKKSPELRKVVRLLEIGSIGLAMAAPHREPPIRLWAGIQTAVTREGEKRGRSAKRIWLHSAAGIAACAIIGWFAYLSWNRSSSAPTSAPGVVAGHIPETAGDVTNAFAAVLAQPTSQGSNLVSRPPRERRSLRPGENATLRERVGDLENQVAHLAQTFNQQQAAPPELNRLTFLDIAPEGSDHAASSPIATGSPELRRALLLGVARQLGWMPPTSAPPQSTLPPPSPTTAPSPDPVPPAPQMDVGVDFVDLPPPPVEAPAPETQTNPAEKPPSPATPATPTDTVAATTSEENSSRNASSIPAFVSGTNLVFAVDSSVLPVGTETVSFYSGTGGGPVRFRGTIALGNSPTVVAMPILQVRTWDASAGSVFFQVRSFDTSTGSQPFAAAILYNSSIEGSAASIRFILPDPSSSNP